MNYYNNDFRVKDEEMPARAYNITIGLILLWGFAINALMCIFCTEFFSKMNFAIIMTIYFIMAIAGIFMSQKSKKPIVSFIGYNLVVLPVGMVLSILLKDYDEISILNAIIITIIVTIAMILLSCFVPNIFLSMGKVLFICLSIVIVFEIIFIIIGFNKPTIWDIGVALIFCGYIGYDWVKAQEDAHTLDNAVDNVVDLYLDIINLFIRILSTSSKGNKSKN